MLISVPAPSQGVELPLRKRAAAIASVPGRVFTFVLVALVETAAATTLSVGRVVIAPLRDRLREPTSYRPYLQAVRPLNINAPMVQAVAITTKSAPRSVVRDIALKRHQRKAVSRLSTMTTAAAACQTVQRLGLASVSS
jgi:hypothetical protein